MDTQPPSTNPPRLLIVEPSTSAMMVLAKRLNEAGYRTICCANPTDALGELHRQPIDLMIAELRMKPLSGVDLTRMVRADTALRETPVLLITGKSDRDGAVDGFGAGADDVVAKPFHFEVLLARIARRLARARAIDRLRKDFERLDERVVTRAIEISELKDRLQTSEAERVRLSQMLPRG